MQEDCQLICKLEGVAMFVALVVSGSLLLGKFLKYAFAKRMFARRAGRV